MGASAGDRRLLMWGFQSTVDYRARLAPAEFEALGFEPPLVDAEVFVSRQEFSHLLQRVLARGHQVAVVPGGSPLLSALAAQEWLLRNGRGSRAGVRFVGGMAAALPLLIEPRLREVIEHATSHGEIVGTLALEHREASAKVMLTVPDGRWLDESLGSIAVAGVRAAIESLRPERAAVGIGGLNKAHPAVLKHTVRAIRDLPCPTLVLMSGDSFRPGVPVPGGRDYWEALFEAVGQAHIFSVNDQENRDLEREWGTGWAGRLSTLGMPIVVIHSPHGVSCRAGDEARARFPDLVDAIDEARREASAHAGVALTGLGARFDGVLGAIALERWRVAGVRS